VEGRYVGLDSSRFKKIFVLVAFLLRFLYADSSFCSFGSEYIGDGIQPALLTSLVVIAILSILYFFSLFLGSYGVKLRIQLKEEYVQLAITIFLISSIAFILPMLCGILEYVGALLGQRGDPIMLSELFLQSLLVDGIKLYEEGYKYEIRFLIFGKLVEAIPEIKLWSIRSQPVSYLGISLDVGIGGGTMIGPFSSMILTLDTILNTFITVAFSSFYVLLIILEFVKEYAFKIILPLGIIFRVIPQTRKASDYFIALSIGLYIFLPALLIMNYYLYQNIQPFSVEKSTAQPIQELLTPLSSIAIWQQVLSALNIFELLNFNNFLQQVARYDFFAFFALGMDATLVTTFVETVGEALSMGFGSLTTRLREAYAPG
jgi:hypothetical protein